LLAVTATADEGTQRVVLKELVMKDVEKIFVSPHRKNLRFSVVKCEKQNMQASKK
jgi:superfamily II DNA helicase RecQ